MPILKLFKEIITLILSSKINENRINSVTKKQIKLRNFATNLTNP